MTICPKCKHVIIIGIWCRGKGNGRDCFCICRSDGGIKEPISILTKEKKLEMMSA